MPRIALPEGVSVHCIVDDFLRPWDSSTPVLMMHGFARNAKMAEPSSCGGDELPGRERGDAAHRSSTQTGAKLFIVD